MTLGILARKERALGWLCDERREMIRMIGIVTGCLGVRIRIHGSLVTRMEFFIVMDMDASTSASQIASASASASAPAPTLASNQGLIWISLLGVVGVPLLTLFDSGCACFSFCFFEITFMRSEQDVVAPTPSNELAQLLED